MTALAMHRQENQTHYWTTRVCCGHRLHVQCTDKKIRPIIELLEYAGIYLLNIYLSYIRRTHSSIRGSKLMTRNEVSDFLGVLPILLQIVYIFPTKACQA